MKNVFVVLFLLPAILLAEGVRTFEGKSGRRKLPEGYILSPIISSSDLSSLRQEKVGTVISLVRTPGISAASFDANGIRQLPLYMGNSIDDDQIDQLMKLGDRTDFLIHCTHGADRTGAVAAFFLAVYKGWSIADALAAVVAPDAKNTAALKQILLEEKVFDSTFAIRPGSGKTGVYATYGPKGAGGHKTTGNYGKLTRSTIRAIRIARERLKKQNVQEAAVTQGSAAI